MKMSPQSSENPTNRVTPPARPRLDGPLPRDRRGVRRDGARRGGYIGATVRFSKPLQGNAMFSEKFGWQPIDTAPIDTDVMLIVTDGGEPYAVLKPFKLLLSGSFSRSPTGGAARRGAAALAGPH